MRDGEVVVISVVAVRVLKCVVIYQVLENKCGKTGGGVRWVAVISVSNHEKQAQVVDLLDTASSVQSGFTAPPTGYSSAPVRFRSDRRDFVSTPDELE